MGGEREREMSEEPAGIIDNYSVKSYDTCLSSLACLHHCVCGFTHVCIRMHRETTEKFMPFPTACAPNCKGCSVKNECTTCKDHFRINGVVCQGNLSTLSRGPGRGRGYHMCVTCESRHH